MPSESTSLISLETSQTAGGGAVTADLATIMPAYNEERTIDRIIPRILENRFVAQLVIVDDASRDGTFERAESWQDRDERVQLLRHTFNKGKGACIRSAVEFIDAPITIIQDADL